MVAVASSMVVQAVPSAAQRCQVMVMVACGSLQVPVSSVRVEPTVVSPLIAGGVELAGAPKVTATVTVEDAVPAPAAFAAATVTRSVLPRSSIPTR